MSTLRQGSIHDQHVDYTLARDYIFAPQYAIGSVTTGISPGGQTNTAQFSAGSPPPAILQAATGTGVSVMKFRAYNDAVTVPWMKYDLDNKQPVYIRHLWTSANRNATDIARFQTTYQSLTTTSQIGTATIAMNVLITSSTKAQTVEWAPTWTGWGKIYMVSTGTSAFQMFPDDTYGLVLNTSLASSSLSNVDLGKSGSGIFLVATEIMYTPKRTFGDGSRREARALIHPLMISEAGPSQDLP